jgi:hypothetical protein
LRRGLKMPPRVSAACFHRWQSHYAPGDCGNQLISLKPAPRVRRATP